jgi:hypothetical protein
VAKADYLPPDKPDEVWELKTSKSLLDKAKPWHEHQAKLYATIFEKDYGVVYQPFERDGLFLKCLGRVKRDDEWFKGELEKLLEFHKKIEEIVKNSKD